MAESPSEERVELLENQVSCLKYALFAMEERVRAMHNTLEAQQQTQAIEIERISSDLVETKADLTRTEAQLADLQSQCDLEYQASRAHEVCIHQLVQASPAHSHIDLWYEVEMYSKERHDRESGRYEWSGGDCDMARFAAENAVTSDPQD
ncbi:hypothetical protein DFH28DRAFT_1141573 [Melampsora americana]|nr:hypothetical protein DFH28DRAFT_1141573 [Melampsora americana]